MSNTIRGFMLVNGLEIIGKIVDRNASHYILEDAVGVGIRQDQLGHATVAFRPVSILAETVPGTFAVASLPIPYVAVLFDYPPADNMLQNYMAMRSNLVVASSLPNTGGRVIN